MATKDLYGKACEAANIANYDYAVELFRQVLRLEPEYPGARTLLRGTERRRENDAGRPVLARIKGLPALVMAAVSFGNPLKKLEHCEDYLEHNPRSLRALIMAGGACAKAGLKESAVGIYKDVLAVSVENKRALRAVAALLEETGALTEAARAYGALARLDPKDRELQDKFRNIQAAAHMKSSGMETATSFRDWVKDRGRADQLEAENRQVSTAQQRSTRLAEAIQELSQDDMNVTKITHLAHLYEFGEDLKSAQRVLEEARKKLPDSFEIRESWGDMRLRAYAKALQKVAAQLRETPDEEKLRARAGRLDAERKEFARKEYEWRVGRHPTDHGIRFQLGQALYELGDYDGAIPAFQAAARDPRHEVDAARMLGQSFGAKNQYDLAIEQYRRAIERKPTMDETGIGLQYLLAEAIEADGKPEEALSIYKRIYSHDITFRDVAQKVTSLSERGTPGRAGTRSQPARAPSRREIISGEQ
ncbi:MAG: tetratricopeptide repeat protein [Candidatus Brocadiia bacterium]|nr:tetratricopeptide repeat protein [Candidatus Brocadiia bacterium]